MLFTVVATDLRGYGDSSSITKVTASGYYFRFLMMQAAPLPEILRWIPEQLPDELNAELLAFLS